MRKKHPEHVNLERWLVSYADFITLLFAFFVIMYAISQADMAKFKAVSQSLSRALGAGPSGMVDIGGNSGSDTAQALDAIQATGGRALNLPAGKTNVASDQDPELQTLKDKLEETVSLELGAAETADKFQFIYDSRGLIVRLAAKDFFEHGDPVIRPEMQPLLDRIGRVLATTKRHIRVEGHTDRTEAHVSGFQDDWALSSERAAWVVKYLVRRFNMDPSRLGVAGYAHYRPLTEREDELSLGKNRRVEILILNSQYEDDASSPADP